MPTPDITRRFAIQGEIDNDGVEPVYRHPIDAEPALVPMTPLVRKIKECAESAINHFSTFNHVLIQLYSTGEDHISEHADKTLDIMHGSVIANWSWGRERCMTLRSKEPMYLENCTSSAGRDLQKVPLLNNSLFILGPESNRLYTHAIKPTNDIHVVDKRRISLTFRSIATFRKADGSLSGQGAHMSGDSAGEKQEMLIAFRNENKTVEKWEHLYGTVPCNEVVCSCDV